MKKFILLFFFFLFLCSCNIITDPSENPQGEDSVTIVDNAYGSDYLFDISALPEITINITLDDWNTFLRNYDDNKDNGLYVPAKFVFTKNNETFTRDSVGLRMRGNTSRRRPEGELGQMHVAGQTNWHHCHFGVKFTEYVTGTKFCKTDRIVLKWHKDDAAYCREVYCYDLFRRFGVWSAPRASYTRLNLYVEGDAEPVYYGIYVLLEGVQKSFLKNRVQAGQWPDKDGNLWKAAWGADLTNTEAARMGVSDETHSYVYSLKTNEATGLAAAKLQLQNFINGMNPLSSGSDKLKTYLETYMDVDLFLRAYAVNVMVGMWDDYWRNQNNFYFYFDSNGRFYFIPYDYDNTLGTSMDINAGTQNLLYWGERDGTRLLMKKVLSISEFENRYKQYIKELAAAENDYFAAAKSMTRIRNWQQMIRPYISNDTGEDMEIADKPASWGNCDFYRILSGNDEGGDNGEANFFTTKIKSITF